MGAIDIGAACIDRLNAGPAGYTEFGLENPANDTGTLTSVEIWFVTNATGCKVGTIYGSSVLYTPRASATLGNVTSGSKQTFTGLSIAVSTGDFIGFYFATGTLEYDDAGASPSIYYLLGDQWGAGQMTYAPANVITFSLYGSGSTPGWTNITYLKGIASTSISYRKGIAVGSISHVKGVAV